MVEKPLPPATLSDLAQMKFPDEKISPAKTTNESSKRFIAYVEEVIPRAMRIKELMIRKGKKSIVVSDPKCDYCPGRWHARLTYSTRAKHNMAIRIWCDGNCGTKFME